MSPSGAPGVQFLDAGGAAIPTSVLADNTIVTLQHPGPYSIVGSVSSHENSGAESKQDHQALSVSVQSMRDALALGYSGNVNESFEIPLPVFMPVDAITDQLSKTLFTDDGKFYPCPQSSDCYKDAGGLYIEWPHVSTAGAWLILKVHLSGHASGFLFFQPGVTGDITAYGVPIIENNILKIDKLFLDVQSQNYLVTYAAGRFVAKLTSSLQTKAQYDISPLLDKARTAANKKFPVMWGSACLMANLDSLSLSSVIPMSAPDGVQANFRASIGYVTPDKCTGTHQMF
jgi:hypothetical protein